MLKRKPSPAATGVVAPGNEKKLKAMFDVGLPGSVGSVVND
jgi:hypothetical protein